MAPFSDEYLYGEIANKVPILDFGLCSVELRMVNELSISYETNR